MTINVNVSVSIAPQTQDFLSQLMNVATRADLADLAELKLRIDRSHARLDLAQKRLDQIDSHLQQKASI